MNCFLWPMSDAAQVGSRTVTLHPSCHICCRTAYDTVGFCLHEDPRMVYMLTLQQAPSPVAGRNHPHTLHVSQVMFVTDLTSAPAG